MISYGVKLGFSLLMNEIDTIIISAPRNSLRILQGNAYKGLSIVLGT